jgi:hypothetical protein
VGRKIANLISIIFHPLLLATYLFTAFILMDPMLVLPPGYTKVAQWLIVLVVWLTTFAIPALSLGLLKYTGNISSLKLQNRKERLLPFFYITIFYGFTAYYFSRQMLVTDITSGIFILTAMMILAASIVTFFWKISVHSVSMGGVVGLLFVITAMLPESPVNYLLLAAILISGLVLSARLKLQAHTPAQVYMGFVLGLLISFMIIYWF